MREKKNPHGDKSHAMGLMNVYLCTQIITFTLKTDKRFIVSFFLVFISIITSAQQNKFIGWAMTVNSIRLSPKFNLIFDSQLRSNDQWKQPETFILRPGLTYVLNKNVSLSTGLALINNWKTIGGVRDGVSDNRIWQQLGINQQVKNAVLQHRIRTEERWIPALKVADNEIVKSDPKFNARFRYFTRWISPFSKTKKLTKGMQAHSAALAVDVSANSRPSTSGSQQSRRGRARPQEPLPASEIQRRNRSLFSHNQISHADQLRLSAQPVRGGVIAGEQRQQREAAARVVAVEVGALLPREQRRVGERAAHGHERQVVKDQPGPRAGGRVAGGGRRRGHDDDEVLDAHAKGALLIVARLIGEAHARRHAALKGGAQLRRDAEGPLVHVQEGAHTVAGAVIVVQTSLCDRDTQKREMR
jgi:hypothetical protein